MSDSVISVENLGKRYRLQHVARNETLRDALTSGAHGLFTLFRPRQDSPAAEDFWAVRDVNFSVARGEVLGVIGRNGAGKSTLLKILSRITEPTTGRITLRGRVASLLEVGTGFHPELTGRENIFLNGAILGMRRVEIAAKFAEIVAFAEIEKFIDTPVKHYSSGMYVRLAFAVAAHLEPEILIVDEVLAVGDAEFQKRCIGKMRNVTQSGRTVLLVSHNLGIVQSLCTRCLLLNQGRVAADAVPTVAVASYLDAGQTQQSFVRPADPKGKPTITAASVQVNEGPAAAIEVSLTIASGAARKIAVELRLASLVGQPVGFGSLGAFRGDQLVGLAQGETKVVLRCALGRLANGSYQLGLALTLPFQEFLDRVDESLTFDVQRAPEAGAHHVLVENWGYGALELPVDRLA